MVRVPSVAGAGWCIVTAKPCRSCRVDNLSSKLAELRAVVPESVALAQASRERVLC